MEFDQEMSRKIEALYVTPEVVEQRRLVREALRLRDGERVLDVGSGPGLLAAELADAVGREGRVSGIDLSAAMVEMARTRCAARPWAEFRTGDAMKLPFADEWFDAAVSTQVFEYLPDIAGALAELHRVVRPGGRIALLDTDYGSLIIHTEDQPRMARVLAAWDEHFVHGSLPRTLSRQLREAGFRVRHRSAIPMFNPEFRDNTYGKLLLAMMASFAGGRRGVSHAEAESWFMEFAALDAEDRFFFSLNRYLFVAERGAGPCPART